MVTVRWRPVKNVGRGRTNPAGRKSICTRRVYKSRAKRRWHRMPVLSLTCARACISHAVRARFQLLTQVTGHDKSNCSFFTQATVFKRTDWQVGRAIKSFEPLRLPTRLPFAKKKKPYKKRTIAQLGRRTDHNAISGKSDIIVRLYWE